MQTLTLNKFFEIFEKMDLDEKEYATEIINKKLIDENRKKILNQINSAKKNFKKGNFKRGSIKDLYKDLENG